MPKQTSTAETTASTSPITPVTSTAGPPNGLGDNKHGLSTGAEVGLGLGIAVLGVAIGVVVGFVVFRRKRSKPNATPDIDHLYHDADQAPAELYSKSRPAELDSMSKAAEIDSRPIAELG